MLRPAFTVANFDSGAADEEMRNIDAVKMILALVGKRESLITFVANRPGPDLRVKQPKFRYQVVSKPVAEQF